MIPLLLFLSQQEDQVVAASRAFNERLLEYIAEKRGVSRTMLPCALVYRLKEDRSVWASPAIAYWSKNGYMWGWSYALYLDEPKNNLGTEECIALAKDYYRFLGGRFELVKRNLDESTEAYRPRYVLLEFDKVVPGTKTRISSGFVASIDVTYGIPLRLSGLYEPPLPPPSPVLARWRIEDSMFTASRTALGWWQSDNAVAPDPVYVQTGDTYRLVYDCTSHDPAGWDAQARRSTRFVVYQVDAVTGQVLSAVPSWAVGGASASGGVRFSWSGRGWGFGRSASRFKVVDTGQCQEPQGKTVRLSDGKTSCQAVWDGQAGLLVTKQGDKWLGGRPERALEALLDALP